MHKERIRTLVRAIILIVIASYAESSLASPIELKCTDSGEFKQIYYDDAGNITRTSSGNVYHVSELHITVDFDAGTVDGITGGHTEKSGNDLSILFDKGTWGWSFNWTNRNYKYVKKFPGVMQETHGTCSTEGIPFPSSR